MYAFTPLYTLASFLPFSFAMTAFYGDFLFVCDPCPSLPFSCNAVALSLFHSYFFPSFVLHGDSLLYKCKYSGRLCSWWLCLFIVPCPIGLCCLAGLPGDKCRPPAGDAHERGSNLEARLHFTRRFS